MSKHTKGPWHLVPFNELDKSHTVSDLANGSIRDAKGELVVAGEYDGMMTPFGSRPDDEAAANAILCTAAPDLLECLRWYVANDDTNQGLTNTFWLAGLERAKEAIAKATGGQS